MIQKVGIALFASLFLAGALCAFAQTEASQPEMPQRGSIPEELLRPRRDEAPRYPIDTVIGPLGQGQATEEAYATARKAAAALLAGNMNAPILATVNKVFLESCMSMLDTITPRYFRLGSGREEPDGSYSFLVRFAGREQGIMGELYVRLEERHRNAVAPPAVAATSAAPAPSEAPAAPEATPAENGDEAAATPAAVPAVTPTLDVTDAGADSALGATNGEAAASVEAAAAENNEEAAPLPPPPQEPAELVWIFEDLILEEARSREAENGEGRQRFDFPPYERFF